MKSRPPTQDSAMTNCRCSTEGCDCGQVPEGSLQAAEKKTDALFFLCVCVSCDAELATATCSSKAPWSKSIFFLYFLSLWVGPTLRFTSCTNFNQHRMPPKNCDICPLPFRLRSKYFFLYFQVKTWLDTFFE